MGIIPFSDEQIRTVINLQQHYEVWMDADRSLARLPYGLKWADRNGKDYLYELFDRTGNGKSLGPRSVETERIFDSYRERKAELTERRNRSAVTLSQTCKVYRALGLPLLPSEAAKILREADRRSLLGSHLMVVGTNALAAYALEMNGRIDGAPEETDDFDMAWLTVDDPSSPDVPVWALLKAVDSTYTVNSERTFQARNAAAYEVELLAAPSRRMSRRDRPVPVPLPEQEWLLPGTRISRVVVARDASPARVVAPDPRWFALQKLWMSDQEKRHAGKRPKDLKQGTALLACIHEALPSHSLNAPDFLAAMPPELQPYHDRFAAPYKEDPLPNW